MQKFVGKQAAIVPGSPAFDEESRLCFAMETCIKEDTDYQRFYSGKMTRLMTSKLDKRKYRDVRYFSTLIDLSYFIMF